MCVITLGQKTSLANGTLLRNIKILYSLAFMLVQKMMKIDLKQLILPFLIRPILE